MIIKEVSAEEYSSVIQSPFSVFDSVAFNDLNKDKVSEVKYLIFKDDKNKFGIILGVSNGELIAPFSAPYACVSCVSIDSKIENYYSATKLLTEYAKSLKVKSIRFTLPPTSYDENHLSKLYNALYINNFTLKSCDLNSAFTLDEFNESYIENLDIKARQKLKASLNNQLKFEKTDNLEQVYNIIQQNRQERGFPLLMTLDQVKKTIQVVKADLFVVASNMNEPIASAIIYHNKPEMVQVIYWGSLSSANNLKPMNFLSYKIFEYYKNKNIKVVDIGPSTENSVANFGLCDFKQSIGCKLSVKFTFHKDL